jgi:transcriptional regulator with XRE-family HTH domain
MLVGTGLQVEFAQRLRDLRDASGLTLRQVATKSGYSQGALSQAESGRSVPSWEITTAFVQTCGANPDAWRQLWEVARDTATNRRVDRTGEPTTDPARDSGQIITDPVRASRSAEAVSTQPPSTTPQSPRASQPRRRFLIATAAALLLAAAAASAYAWYQPRPDPSSRTRYSFEETTAPWGIFWQGNELTPSITSQIAYDGSHALKLQVHPSSTPPAFGTTHIGGLRPGSMVTFHVWYGGQGHGRLLPFVQNTTYGTDWSHSPPLTLSDAGWITYTWEVPAVPLRAIAFQLDTMGSETLIIALDAIAW